MNRRLRQKKLDPLVPLSCQFAFSDYLTCVESFCYVRYSTRKGGESRKRANPSVQLTTISILAAAVCAHNVLNVSR